MRNTLILSLFVLIPAVAVARVGSTLADSTNRQSANALVAEMASLIKEHASVLGNQYDTWADTTKGLKLYVSIYTPTLANPGDPDWYWLYVEPEWYQIDFEQPIKPDELKVVVGRNDNFYIDASKKVTKRTERKMLSGRTRREKHQQLTIFFARDKNKRTTDFGQLHKRLAAIVDQLIHR